ncbi:MAG: hypothetical protein Q4G10_05530 [Bacteroidia bacterium]|nr:hypothetical protein [Bacteroidia bacterium]
MKNDYMRITVIPVASFPENTLLADSVANNSMVQSVGQEVGPVFDMSTETDAVTGKTFNHEWDAN